MGYVYEKNWKTGRQMLCCDSCGTTEKVKKFRCPFGYCPAPALCPACAVEHKVRHKATHIAKGCDVRSARIKNDQERRSELMSAGKLVRYAATRHGAKGVKVLFKNAARERAYWMPKAVYRSIPLSTPAVVADYQRIGVVVEADSVLLFEAR